MQTQAPIREARLASAVARVPHSGGGMRTRHVLTVIAVAVLLASSACPAATRTVYIELVGRGTFQVIYHRALSNATGTAIAGVIGAGVQFGVEAGRDASKTDQLEPLIEKDAWQVKFLDTLNSKLETEGYEAVWVEDSSKVTDGIILKIYPESYGYRMVNTSTRLVSAYVDFDASFSSAKTARSQDREAFYLTHTEQYPYEHLLLPDSPVNTDLEALLEKAAKRLANKIVYSVKE